MPTTIARKRGALKRRTVKRVVSQKQKRGGGGGVRTRGRGRSVRTRGRGRVSRRERVAVRSRRGGVGRKRWGGVEGTSRPTFKCILSRTTDDDTSVKPETLWACVYGEAGIIKPYNDNGATSRFIRNGGIGAEMQTTLSGLSDNRTFHYDSANMAVFPSQLSISNEQFDALFENCTHTHTLCQFLNNFHFKLKGCGNFFPNSTIIKALRFGPHMLILPSSHTTKHSKYPPLDASQELQLVQCIQANITLLQCAYFVKDTNKQDSTHSSHTSFSSELVDALDYCSSESTQLQGNTHYIITGTGGCSADGNYIAPNAKSFYDGLSEGLSNVIGVFAGMSGVRGDNIVSHDIHCLPASHQIQVVDSDILPVGGHMYHPEGCLLIVLEADGSMTNMEKEAVILKTRERFPMVNAGGGPTVADNISMALMNSRGRYAPKLINISATTTPGGTSGTTGFAKQLKEIEAREKPSLDACAVLHPTKPNESLQFPCDITTFKTEHKRMMSTPFDAKQNGTEHAKVILKELQETKPVYDLKHDIDILVHDRQWTSNLIYKTLQDRYTQVLQTVPKEFTTVHIAPLSAGVMLPKDNDFRWVSPISGISLPDAGDTTASSEAHKHHLYVFYTYTIDILRKLQRAFRTLQIVVHCYEATPAYMQFEHSTFRQNISKYRDSPDEYKKCVDNFKKKTQCFGYLKSLCTTDDSAPVKVEATPMPVTGLQSGHTAVIAVGRHHALKQTTAQASGIAKVYYTSYSPYQFVDFHGQNCAFNPHTKCIEAFSPDFNVPTPTRLKEYERLGNRGLITKAFAKSIRC